MNVILESDRLIIRSLMSADKDLFYEMMSDPEVMNPIPQALFSKDQSDQKLAELIEIEPQGEKLIWAIIEQGNNDLIGICGFLINTDGNRELAYRFRSNYWGKGYGTEVAKALLVHGFKELNYGIIDGDAWKENTKSVKILTKFMTKVDEFWNENDGCIDVRYRVEKNEYFNL
ncbi:MAG: GNAT family N-acetyltransferase [Crocinitomicaceae bacterium]